MIFHDLKACYTVDRKKSDQSLTTQMLASTQDTTVRHLAFPIL